MIRLANPYLLLTGIILLPLFLTRKTAFFGYTHLGLLEADGGWRWWQHLPQVLFAIAMALLILGLARPQWEKVVQHETFLARDIILIVDLSNSMQNNMGGTLHLTDEPRKIDIAKKAARQFVQKRKNDRIGLLVFGDETFGSWPLTRDLDLILKKVDRLGSTFYGGTNLVQPLVKAMDHFRDMGQSASRILVFLSDGESVISSRMKETITRRIKEIGVRFYLVGINLRKEYTDLLEIVDRTEGRFIPAESEEELTAAFEEIDRLEPGRVKIENKGKSQELYPLFVLSALVLLLVLTLLRNTLLVELG
jgi:Ca-activated chloride channel family protein